MAEYRTIVDREMGGMNCAILGLNAGIAVESAPLHLQDDCLVDNIMRVNALQVVYLLKIFEERMLKRAERSAIMITSSIASKIEFPGSQTYSATKLLVSNFGEAIHYEVSDRIDVLSWTPAGVRTKIFVDSNNCTKEEEEAKLNNKLFLDTDVAVKTMLVDLGKSAVSFGHFKHQLTYCMVWCFQSIACN